MKVLIVDDEMPARARLRRLLEEIEGCQVVGEAASGAEALDQTAALHPEVVLMDIRMPGMDGLEAAARLATLEAPPAVIFTTAYDEHALAAFRAQAADYLLKPVRQERLAESLQRVRRLNRSQLATLRSDEQPSARAQLTVRVRGGLRLVPLDEVVYFLAEDKYVTVRALSGEFLIEDALKALEQEFGRSFVRVHRNALVSTLHLDGIEKDALGRYQVRLRGVAERLEVSRRHLPALRQLFKER